MQLSISSLVEPKPNLCHKYNAKKHTDSFSDIESLHQIIALQLFYFLKRIILFNKHQMPIHCLFQALEPQNSRISLILYQPHFSTTYCRIISFCGGQFWWIFAYSWGCDFIDVPVFSFSRKTKSFTISFHGWCKLVGESSQRIPRKLSHLEF